MIKANFRMKVPNSCSQSSNRFSVQEVASKKNFICQGCGQTIGLSSYLKINIILGTNVHTPI